jgi:hypothetical protein
MLVVEAPADWEMPSNVGLGLLWLQAAALRWGCSQFRVRLNQLDNQRKVTAPTLP